MNSVWGTWVSLYLTKNYIKKTGKHRVVSTPILGSFRLLFSDAINVQTIYSVEDKWMNMSMERSRYDIARAN